MLNNKVLTLSRLKDFAGNNFNVAEILQFFFDVIEKIVEKGENTGYQYFHFPWRLQVPGGPRFSGFFLGLSLARKFWTPA